MRRSALLSGGLGGAALAFTVLAATSPGVASAVGDWFRRARPDSVPVPGAPHPSLPPASDEGPSSPPPRHRSEGPGVAVASLDGGSAAAAEPPANPAGANPAIPTPASVTERPPLVGNAKDLHPDALLGALSKETRIFERPNPKSRVLGLARTGSLLRRAVEPAGFEGCSGGWYRVEPEGYVCVGKTATLDLEHPVLAISSYQPDRSRSMPYLYGRSRYPTPPLYTRLPTPEEQANVEHDLAGHTAKNFGALWASEADTPPPPVLARGERVPRPFGYPLLERDYMTGRALTNSAFAFIDLFESEGRRYGLTADLSLIPLDRVTPVQASEFAGRVLPEGSELNVAFVYSHKEMVYRALGEGAGFAAERAAGYRESFLLTGRNERFAGKTFWETSDGHWVRDGERIIRIEKRANMPKWATGRRTWLDISLLRQTLVAYEGETPRFATLVSTGRDGIGDPATTHSTVQGVFLVHTKHVTATMSGDAADDEFDLRDVPWVQYFHEGYALHAAFWHDGFGGPRSHGCINLAPADARYLFTWTDPPVPVRWHSALSREGTLVYIHP